MLISLPGSMKTMIYPSEALLHCVSATVVHLHRCLGFATSFVFAATFLTFICSVFFFCVCVWSFVCLCVCVHCVLSFSLVCSEALRGGFRNSGFRWRTQRARTPSSENQLYKQYTNDRREKVVKV